MKKSLSILLALVMVLSFFAVIPVSVSAVEADLTVVGVQSDFSQPGSSRNNASNCVTYAQLRFQEVYGFALHGTGGDNARGYYVNAASFGDTVSSTPRSGALAVWDYDTGGWGSHVAFVEKVSGNTVYITEGGYLGGYNEGEISLSSPDRSWSGHYQKFLGYVYVKGSGSAPDPKPSNAWIKASASSVYTGTSVTFTFGADNIGHANLYIKKDDVDWKYVDTAPSGYSVTFTEPGTYAAFIAAINGAGVIWSSKVYVTVTAPPVPGKSTITKFEVVNWSDGSFRLLNIEWTATSNTTSYEMIFYDYNNSGTVTKSIDYDSNTTSATLHYNDVPKGKYWVCIKSKNSYGANWSESKLGDFVAPPKPTSAWVKVSKSNVAVGEAVAITFGGENTTYNTNYWLTVKRDGTAVIDENANEYRFTGKDFTFDTPGTYTAFVNAHHNSGSVISPEITFTVYEPVCLGADFKANITNSVEVKNIGVDSSGNVKAQAKNDKDEQRWHFVMQSDNSYKVTNVKTGKYLTATTEKVYTSTDDGSNSQRFYFRENYYGYSIISKTTGLAIVISGDDITQCEFAYYGLYTPRYFTIDGYFDTKPSKTLTYNGHTYEYYDVRMPWTQAYRFCENKGGHLVTITSAEENSALYDMSKDKSAFWTGATCWGNGRTWYWITGEPFEYTNWNTGEPNNYDGAESFSAFYPSNSGKWNDLPNIPSFSGTKPCFVCEYDNGDVNADDYKPSDIVEANGVKYGIFDYRVDWQTAEAICVAKGGHLVKIESAEMNDTVVSIIAQGAMDEYWIDATDRFSEGIWTYHDGTPITYSNWTDENPENDFNTEQYAVIMKHNNKWADIKGFSPSYRKTGFICEYTPAPSLIKLNKDDITLTEGKTYQLTATVTPAKADQTVTWRSSKTSVATVDKNGKVKAVGEGTAIIYAETANGLSAPCVITVKKGSSVICGDTDGDGEVTIFDATAIQRHLAGLPTANYVAAAADADGDGDVTVIDATAIQRYLADLPTEAKNIGNPI